MAPEVGFEPTTNRLTADRSTTELLRSVVGQNSSREAGGFKRKSGTLGPVDLNLRSAIGGLTADRSTAAFPVRILALFCVGELYRRRRQPEMPAQRPRSRRL